MKLISKTWLFLPWFLFFLSCATSQNNSSSIAIRSDGYESNSVNNTEADPALSRFIVPPELGVVQGRIRSSGTSFGEVTELLKTISNKLESGVAQTKGCSFNLIDYKHPFSTWSSRKSLGSKSNKFSGSLKFEVLISLAETNNIRERIKQINSCLQAIPSLELEPEQQDKDTKINFYLSGVLPTVKDAGKYRQELLKFKSKPFKEVVKLAEPATQFDANDTKCTSQGIVTIASRTLSAIELDIDFDCRRLTKK